MHRGYIGIVEINAYIEKTYIYIYIHTERVAVEGAFCRVH